MLFVSVLRIYMVQCVKIELIYALSEQQWQYTLDLGPDITVEQAIQLSGVLQDCPELQPGSLIVGIWGKRVPLSQVLQEYDRIELYRPLLIEPKQARHLIVKKERQEKKLSS